VRALFEVVTVAGAFLGVFKFLWATRPEARRRKNIERLRRENEELDKIIHR
jgi:hypothetical protein